MSATDSFDWTDITVVTNTQQNDTVYKDHEKIIMGFEGIYYSKDLKYIIVICGFGVLAAIVTYACTGFYYSNKKRLPCFDAPESESDEAFYPQIDSDRQ